MVNIDSSVTDGPTTYPTVKDEQLDPKAKKAAHGAFSGFFIDMYDIYLPVVALGPAMVYFLSPSMPASQVVIVTSLIFVSTLLGRPIGALIGGRFADRLGRKIVNIVAVSGYGFMSFAMAAMPGYETWGILAVVLFIVLRLVDGIFVGASFIREPTCHGAPAEKEARYVGGLHHAGVPSRVRCHLCSDPHHVADRSR